MSVLPWMPPECALHDSAARMLMGSLRVVPIVFALLAAVAQQPEPPVLPAGQFCQHPIEKGAAPAHPCNCQRKCLPNIEVGPDGKPHATITVQEDPRCKQYCHADHCHCPAMNCE